MVLKSTGIIPGLSDLPFVVLQAQTRIAKADLSRNAPLKKMFSLSLHARRTWYNSEEELEIGCCFSSAITIIHTKSIMGSVCVYFYLETKEAFFEEYMHVESSSQQKIKQERSRRIFPHSLKSRRNWICTQLDLRSLLKAGYYAFLCNCWWCD